MTTTTKEKAISVENLSFAYDNDEWIIKDASFSVEKGEILGIVGKSGTGKTTLAYILKGLIPHHIRGKLVGKVVVDRFNIKKSKMNKVAKTVGLVFQDVNSQLFSNTVLEEVEFGLKNFKMDKNLAFEALRSLKIEDLANKSPLNLSAGQKQRVIIASIIAPMPQILILDEPTAHLDYSSKQDLIEWLKRLNREQGTTILIIEQDPKIIGELCEGLIYLKGNTISRIPKDQIMEKRSEYTWKL